MPIRDPLSDLRVVAFLSDGECERGAAAIRSVFSRAALETGGIAAATAYLQTAPVKPSLAIVDLDGVEDPAAAMAGLSRAAGPKLCILAVGSRNDVALYRKMIAQGADEYLPKPLDADDLAEAGKRALKLEAEKRAGSGGKVIACVGAHGGAGATTLAVNLAWLLSHDLKQRSLLFDLDIQFGAVALALDLVPGPGLVEALRHPARVDSLLLASTIMPCGDNLAVLAAEDELGSTPPVTAQSVLPLVDILAEDYDALVLDCPRATIQAQAPLLARLDVLFIVSEPSLTGMRDAMRLASLARGANPGLDLQLVLNRSGKKGAGLPDKQFSEGAGLPVAYRLPEDAEQAAKCAFDGKCLVAAAPRSKLTAELRRIAASFDRDGGGKPGHALGLDSLRNLRAKLPRFALGKKPAGAEGATSKAA